MRNLPSCIVGDADHSVPQTRKLVQASPGGYGHPPLLDRFAIANRSQMTLFRAPPARKFRRSETGSFCTGIVPQKKPLLDRSKTDRRRPGHFAGGRGRWTIPHRLRRIPLCTRGPPRPVQASKIFPTREWYFHKSANEKKRERWLPLFCVKARKNP